jgi:hypothetical protein
MTTQQTVITAIKKVFDKGDIECPRYFPLFPLTEYSIKGILIA